MNENSYITKQFMIEILEEICYAIEHNSSEAISHLMWRLAQEIEASEDDQECD